MSAIPDTSLGRRSIGEILLEHGYVTKEQVDAAVAEQAQTGRPLGQILVESGTITRLELASALAEQWSDSGAPIAPPVGLTLSGTVPTLEPLDTAEASSAPVVAVDGQPELIARLEALEDAVRTLESADASDGQAELRAALDAVSERVEALATDETGDAPLQELIAAVGELQDRLGTTSETAESAVQRANDVAGEAAASLERSVGELQQGLRAELQTFAERMSVYASGEDVERLREVVEALAQRPARDPELAAQIEDLQEVVEELGQRSTRDPDLVGQIEDLQTVVEALSQRPARDAELGTQVDTLAIRFSELVDRMDVLGAAVQSISGDADALHELQGALAELATRPLADPASERRLDELARMFEELAQQPVADPAAEQRVEALAVALEDLRSTTQALAERPVGDPDLDAKLFELTSRLAELEQGSGLDDVRVRVSALERGEAEALDELRARIADLSDRPTVDPSLVHRLAELEGKVDGLPVDEALERIEATERSLGYRIDGAVARVDEITTALEQVAAGSEQGVTREAWEEAVALLNSRIEAERELGARLGALEERIAQVAQVAQTAPAGDGKAAAADPKLAKQIAALSARVDQLAAGGAVPVADNGDGTGEAPSGPTPATLERDVEHVLMAIERLSVHLGAHERALTELMGPNGVGAQMRQLTARVGDLESFGGGGGSGGSGDGGAMRAELGSLMRRLEEAETAQKKDRERVIEQLEKAAGAIDWRLQRLESTRDDEPGA
jgi:hypothetical protein